MTRILVIDNFDSFVYNLVQYLGELGAEPVVIRNNEMSVHEAAALQPDGVLLSPGPGRPEDAGILCDAIREFAGRVPVFGVCLGHQAIGRSLRQVAQGSEREPKAHLNRGLLPLGSQSHL